MPGFSKLLYCGCQYVCVLCVHVPKTINNYSSEMKPEKLVKQVMMLSGLYLQHLIFFKGMALATKHTLNSVKEGSGKAVLAVI